MEDIFDPVYRKDYYAGYAIGLNPFAQSVDITKNGQAFNSGFANGRANYENMNGSIINGIPKRILTDKILEEFLLAGMLGMNIDADGYTAYQITIIEEWYKSGIENYDPDQSIYLMAILESNGIQTK